MTKPCLQWDFDNSTYSRTLTSQYQLVCGRQFLRTAYHSLFMIGNLFGPPIAGYFSDKHGRKNVAVAGCLVLTVAAVILPFIPSLPGILAVRFIMGFANLPTAYILAMEVCEPNKRSYVGILLVLPWALGTMAYGAIAYLVRDWEWLQCIVSFPLLVFLPAIWLLDESPRWLIVAGQHEKALVILKKAARWNKATLPPDSELRAVMIEIQRESNEARAQAMARESDDSLTESQRSPDPSKSRRISSNFACLLKCGLCSTVHIRIVTLVMTLCFCVSSMVFHGLTLSSKNFSINVFAYIIVGGLVEVPAYSLSAVVVDKFGRRKPLSICFFVCGLSLVAIVVSPQGITWLIMLLAMVGKLGICSAGQMNYLYLSELYPTEYRLQGMGVAILAQRFGSMMGPVIVSVMSPLSWWGPSAFMGAMTLLASLATLALPETLGAVLPDTLADLAELFANKRGKKNHKSDGESPDTTEESKPMRT